MHTVLSRLKCPAWHLSHRPCSPRPLNQDAEHAWNSRSPQSACMALLVLQGPARPRSSYRGTHPGCHHLCLSGFMHSENVSGTCPCGELLLWCVAAHLCSQPSVVCVWLSWFAAVMDKVAMNIVGMFLLDPFISPDNYTGWNCWAVEQVRAQL